MNHIITTVWVLLGVALGAFLVLASISFIINKMYNLPCADRDIPIAVMGDCFNDLEVK